MKQDLTDAELDELGDLLDRAPAPLEPLDLLTLDGYLAGVLVQPRAIPIDEWLPPVFTAHGGPLPDAIDPGWHARTSALIERRRDALNAEISEDGWFDPLVVDLDRAPPASEYDAVQLPASRALLPWVAGFHWARECFAALDDVGDDAMGLLLARIDRHLPPETDADREAIAALDRERPLVTLDAAIEDLVAAVVEIWDLTAKERFAVATVRRDTPKVGRNEPCPCGSGKKFKACHGA
nr:UPF0149 family protein [Aquincola sp.]